jgi:hypothetical protein
MLFGVPAVRFSVPPPVTRMSSSMRTPIPRNSLGIAWVTVLALAFSSSSSFLAAAMPRRRRRSHISSSLYSYSGKLTDSRSGSK